jgi:hypothetical protein
MQTFLPYPDFKQSMQILDYRRLGKQRVEAMQLINAIESKTNRGWSNHPATKMWRSYVDALKLYHNEAIIEWVRRGYKNTMKLYQVDYIVYPHWLGDADFHKSHQSNLYHKSPADYPEFEMEFIPYIWNN